MKFKFAKTLFIAMTVLLLGACGSGGDDGAADKPLTIQLSNLQGTLLSGTYDAVIKFEGSDSNIQKVRLVRLELLDPSEVVIKQMEVGYFDGAITGTMESLDTTMYPNGSYKVVLKAFDGDAKELATWSADIQIDNTPAADTENPLVTNFMLSNPTVTTGTAVSITAIATDNVGVVAVEVLVDGVVKGAMAPAGTANNYTFSLATPTNGTFAVQVRAADAAGNFGLSVVKNLTVQEATVVDTIVPTVGNLTLSASTVTVGTPVTITVTATDNIAVTSVNLMRGGISIGSFAGGAGNTYTYTLNTPNTGTFTLQAEARDAANNAGFSNQAALVVEPAVVEDTTPPVVGALSLSAAKVTKGTPVIITVNATDNVGVVAVDLYVAGSKVSAMSAAGGNNYTYTLATPNAGSFLLQAWARDAAGNVKQSASQTLEVEEPVVEDTVAPQVGALTANNTTVDKGTPISLTVSATDNVGVVAVELLSNSTVVGTFSQVGASTVYTYTYNTPAGGNFALQARARDAAGLIALSNMVNVTVNDVVEDTTAPVVGSLTLSAATVTEGTPVTVTVTATDDVGVAAVDLYVDGALKGSFSSAGGNNYTYTLATTNIGTFLLQARARDAAANVAMSDAKTLTVNEQVTEDTTPPVLSSFALSSASVNVGTPVTVTVAATDDVGVTAVELYVDGALKGSFSSAGGNNYTYSLATPTAGTFQLQARARDAANNPGTSNTLSLTVNASGDSEAPVVSSITLSSATISPGDVVTVSATVTDNVGVTAVELHANGTKKADMTKSGNTYSYSWNTTGLANGPYQLQVKARDAAGNNGESPIRIATIATGSDWVSPPAVPFSSVTSFGDNPGQLKMFMYVPADMPENAPLVMAMHGCNQNGKALTGGAGEMANPTGHAQALAIDSEWHKLADRYKFYVIYPEQTVRVTNPNDANQVNNDYACFNWAGFYGNQFGRDKGESKSLMSMIDHIRNNPIYSVDNERIFVTGLSAGAAMSVVMAAHYPDVIAGAAPMAGVVYGCPVWDNATGLTVKNRSFDCMGVNSGFSYIGMPASYQRTADAWLTIAKSRGPQSYTGKYPTMMIWQGSSDNYVDYKNMGELVKQWTAVHGIDQTPDNAGSRLKASHTTHTYAEYKNGQGEVKVATVTLTGMKHGISVDTSGTGEDAGGKAQSGVIPFAYWAYNTGLYSSYYTAKFWGLDQSSGPVSNVKVTITSPAANATLNENAVTQITATATEDALGISYVEFFADGQLVCTDTAAPYTCDWNTTGIATGTKVKIQAVAYSNITYETGSQSIDVWVGEQGFTCVDYSATMYAHRTATPPRATVVGTCTIFTAECTYTLTGSNQEVKIAGSQAASTAVPLKETAAGYFEQGTCN